MPSLTDKQQQDQRRKENPSPSSSRSFIFQCWLLIQSSLILRSSRWLGLDHGVPSSTDCYFNRSWAPTWHSSLTDGKVNTCEQQWHTCWMQKSSFLGNSIGRDRSKPWHHSGSLHAALDWWLSAERQSHRFKNAMTDTSSLYRLRIYFTKKKNTHTRTTSVWRPRKETTGSEGSSFVSLISKWH